MIDEQAALELALRKLGGPPNARRETSWGWYFWRIEAGYANERVTVTREGALGHIPLRSPRIVPAPGEGTYRSMASVEEAFDELDALELAQENAFWPLTLGESFTWGWVFWPVPPAGQPMPRRSRAGERDPRGCRRGARLALRGVHGRRASGAAVVQAAAERIGARLARTRMAEAVRPMTDGGQAAQPGRSRPA